MNTTPTPDQTPERRDADCPICGKFARNWNSNNCKLSCSDTSCPGFKIDLHPNEWNHRPLEDALRARLAEAEKDAKADDNRLAAQSQRISDLIYMRDTLRATNATLTERVRRLEEALTALSNSAKAAAEWCNTSMMDTEIMHAESILTDSASPVLPIKQAFCALHQAWLVAHHRSCMNETMDALAVVLGLDPMNPRKGLPSPGAAVGKEGE